jgi:hypothetical protein
MTKKFLPVFAFVLPMMLATSSMSFAGEKAGKSAEACTCSTKCAASCKEGKANKDCDCKACDCAKTGKCEHGKCGHGSDGEHKH